jgi:hypothetical protein
VLENNLTANLSIRRKGCFIPVQNALFSWWINLGVESFFVDIFVHITHLQRLYSLRYWLLLRYFLVFYIAALMLLLVHILIVFSPFFQFRKPYIICIIIKRNERKIRICYLPKKSVFRETRSIIENVWMIVWKTWKVNAIHNGKKVVTDAG